MEETLERGLTIKNPFRGEGSTTCACIGERGMAGWNLHLIVDNIKVNGDAVSIQQYERGWGLYELSRGITADVYVSLDKRDRLCNFKIPVNINRLMVGVFDESFVGYCFDNGAVIKQRFIEVVQNTLDAVGRYDMSTVFVTVDDILFSVPLAASVYTGLLYKYKDTYAGGCANLEFAVDFNLLSERLCDYLLADYKDENVEYVYCVYNKGEQIRNERTALLANASDGEVVDFLLKRNPSDDEVEVVAHRCRIGINGDRVFESSKVVVL